MTDMLGIKKILFLIINSLAGSLILTFLIRYTNSLKGPLNYIGYVLFLPSYLIISLFKGVNEAMHFTRYSTFLWVSFIFYSFFIALIQLIILKMKRSMGSSLKR